MIRLGILLRRASLCALHTAGLLSCAPQSDKAAPTKKNEVAATKTCLAIVNGAETQTHNDVGLLLIFDPSNPQSVQICSGTFVSDSTMITASHCLEEHPTGRVVYYPGKTSDLLINSFDTSRSQSIKPVSVVLGAPAVSLDKGADSKAQTDNMANDVAVVIFPKNTASTWAKVRRSAVAPNTAVDIVGYGRTDAYANIEGKSPQRTVRRIGHNHLTKIPPEFAARFDGTLTIAGRVETQGSTAAADALGGHGDSGGGMFAGNVLIGAASITITKSENAAVANIGKLFGSSEAMTAYVDLTADFAKSLLQKAEKQGAKINYEVQAGDAETPSSDDAEPAKEPDC